jgi:rubrerythrin
MGEEYYVLVQMKTLKYMTRMIRESYNVDLEDLRGVFDSIIRDEENHLQLLAKMRKFMIGQQVIKVETRPAFKYTNPDAWRKPLPDSVFEGAT